MPEKLRVRYEVSFNEQCSHRWLVSPGKDGAIKIIEPKSGYVITPINFENYHHGDPAEEMNFILQGNPKLNGKVNVTLIWNKDNKKKVKVSE